MAPGVGGSGPLSNLGGGGGRGAGAGPRGGRGAAEVRAEAVPALPGALEALDDGAGMSGGGRRNQEYAEAFTTFDDGVSTARRRLAWDPAPAGGLLVAVPADHAGEIDGAAIGRMVEGEPGAILLL